MRRSTLLFALALAITSCAGSESVGDAGRAPGTDVQGESVERYRAVDLDWFVRREGAVSDPLVRGLGALVEGDAPAAERALRRAASAVPDSLRPFVYGRLEGLASRQFDWDGALRYAALRAEAEGRPFDPSDVKASAFADAPRPSAEVPGGAVTVPFDGYRADGALAGPAGAEDVRFFLDTGAPVTLLSRRLADRLGLAIDSASVGAVSIPARGIDGAPVYRTTIDRVRLGPEAGGVVLRNVPADVIDTERPVTDGADLFLGFDALSGLLGGVRFGFADSTLTAYDRGQTPPRDAAPNLLLEAGYALLSYTADGQPFTGVVDTGSPFSYVYADGWTPSAGAEGRPVTHRGQLADTEYEFTLDYYDLPATLAGQAVEALPLGLNRRGQVAAPFRVMSLLGTGLFADGALTLDFDRRVATYDR